MKKILIIKNPFLLTLACFLLLSALARAVAPANDNFVNTAVLPTNSSLAVDNTDATVEPGDFSYLGYRTLWYRYTAPIRGVVTITTPVQPATGFSHQINVFRGNSPSALNFVTSDNASNTGYVRVIFLAEAGMEFRISVGGSYTESKGIISLFASQSAWPYGSGAVLAPLLPTTNAPANDNFANADVIPNSSPITTVFAYNNGATVEPGDPDVGYRTLWYRYTAPARGIINISTPTQNIVGFSHRIRVFQGNSLSSLSYINSITGSNSSGVNVNFAAEAGSEYYIVFAGIYSDSSGTAVFSVQEDSWPYGNNTVLAPRFPINSAPYNDNSENADVIPNNAGPVTVFGFSTNATLQAGEGGSYRTLWYDYTVPSDGYLDLQVVKADFRQAIGIISVATGEVVGTASGASAHFNQFVKAGTRLGISFGSLYNSVDSAGPFVFNLTHLPYVNKAPTVKILSPRNNSIVSKKGVLTKGQAFDDQNDIQKFELRVNGKRVAYAAPGGNLFTRTLKGTKATIQIRAQDGQGLWGPYATVRVKVK